MRTTIVAPRTVCIVSLAAAALLGGCVAKNTPGDLAFASVRLTDWRDQPELPKQGLSDLQRSATSGDEPSRPTLRVEFTSATNLARFAIGNSWQIVSDAFPCGREGISQYLSLPTVFWRGIEIDSFSPDPIGTAAGRWNFYYFFVDVARERRIPRGQPGDPPIEAYDLRRAPEDVCFYLGGGSWPIPRRYRSNTVTVPKEAIAAALGGPPPGN